MDPSLAVSALLDLITHEWDLSTISYTLPSHIKDQIKSIHVASYNLEVDKRIWSFSRDGNVSVKVCSNWIIQDHDSPMVMRQMWTSFWKMNCPPYIKHFLWLLVHGKTLVRENLRRRGLDIPRFCPLCCKCDETISHLFFTCEQIKPLWDAIAFTYHVQFRSSHAITLDWFLNVLNLPAAKLLVPWKVLFPFILWSVWCYRNKLVFSGTCFHWQETLQLALSNATEFLHATTTPTQQYFKDSMPIR
ncbi:hypothetical protein MKX03_032112 [Papaver bracteatum]|nr:hypothetical protein MKX03_032112 [Papaver bracteatum]